MTRRIQPPPHPTTGHPYVDNALRNAWREYRDYLAKMGIYERYVATYGGGSDTEDSYFIVPMVRDLRVPRKPKKTFVKETMKYSFSHHDPTYYTPKRALL